MVTLTKWSSQDTKHYEERRPLVSDQSLECCSDQGEEVKHRKRPLCVEIKRKLDYNLLWIPRGLF
jgi:hypothetical protein